jgi:hypothetical protein
MKKKIFGLVFVCLVVILVSTSALAATGSSSTWLTNPILRLWNAIHKLQTQMTSIALTPGPQGEPGPQGLPGECSSTISATEFQSLVARVEKLEQTGGALPDCIDDSDCDDNNPCTDDACDPAAGCVYSNNSLCGGTSGGTGSDGELIVTEIMYNPDVVSDTAGEWLELYNSGASTLNLNGWGIQDYGTDSFTISEDVIVQPGDYVVLCKNSDSALNGGIACDYQYSSFTLGNTADAVVVLNPDAEVIDEAAYDVSIEPWKSLNKPGYSLQLDPSHYNSADNDNGAYWCNALEPLASGDFGTPGGANSDCSLG